MEYDVGESTDFLVSKLKKDFPGFKLRPHTKLLFTEESMKLLQQGARATIRYEKGTIRYPAAHRLPLIESSLRDPQHRIDRGMIGIKKISVKKFGELTEEDAAQTGLYAMEKVKKMIQKIFGSIREGEYISLYYFE